MKWSLRIGTLFGIGVYVHFTFLIILVWFAALHWTRGDDLSDTLFGLAMVGAIFFIVVLHELGHALAARRYGIETKDITLLPIGGVARLERMPEDPKQELVVAIAGPMVNVVLAVLFLGLTLLIGSLASDRSNALLYLSSVFGENASMKTMTDLTIWQQAASICFVLFAFNVIMVLFNLLPAFPMDGGRVLRAFLAMHMDYVQATQVAAGVGQFMAFLFGFFGLFYNPFLVFIALFVWMGATAEAAMVQRKFALTGIPIRSVMITHFETVRPDETLGDAATHVLAGFQQDFPVVDEGKVVGMLTKHDLLRALAESGNQAPISGVMRTDFQVATPSEMLQTAYERLQNGACNSMPIVANGQLVGVIDLENVGEFIAIRSALRQSQG
ncbi:site-2 protease family protein [Blastopirellula sp. JC732]|uniref:Zinc metalloprotease n=1 Tax=Blastopirellula sediminis TaxID=2894196 RepID=A0A9X1MQC1_9BACT|nr:site-2 protease family protein [Blastopirellula sediminis]MCC9606267.1 site-2 protease family protein [Blastopirellula sediminis]MCC9630435.1 site-2 protease family protein [Blastopirellula sediminis]